MNNYIDSNEISLSEWLLYIEIPSEERTFKIIDWQFATPNHFNEYMNTIDTRSDKEIKDLISSFLITGGHLGSDDKLRSWISTLESDKILTMITDSLFLKQIITLNPAWPSIEWILDLLPRFPQKALEVLTAYSLAHCLFITDGRATGLNDVISIIKAKYMEHPLPIKESLLSITPREFELLVAYLYKKKRYKVTITSQSRDGGYDVIAEKNNIRENEKLYIECKRYSNNIGVVIARQVLGTLTINNATKAVIICSSHFTKPAKDAAAESKRLELIDIDNFDMEMRTNVDYNWISKISTYINEIKKDYLK